MDLVLEPDADGARAAVRLSIEQAGVSLAARASTDASAWWRAGVEDALQRKPCEVAASRYDAAPPRSTRGATRA